MDFYADRGLAKQKQREALHAGAKRRMDNNQFVQNISIKGKRLYERDDVRQFIFAKKTWKNRWYMARKIRIHHNSKDDEFQYCASASEYCAGVYELAEMTLEVFELKERKAVNFCPTEAQERQMFVYIDETLNVVKDEFYSRSWSDDYNIRMSLWGLLMLLVVLMNFQERKSKSFFVVDTYSRTFAQHPKKPLTKWTQKEVVYTVDNISKNWGRFELTPEVKLMSEQLLTRVSFLCVLSYLDTDPDLDMVGMYTTFLTRKKTKKRKVILNFCLKMMGFFFDFGRAEFAQSKFLSKFKRVETKTKISDNQMAKFREWFEGITKERSHGPMMNTYKKHFYDNMLRPGDIDIFRHADKSQALYGTDIDTTSAVNSMSVFNKVHAAESAKIAGNFGKNMQFVLEMPRINPYVAEASDLALQVVFTQVLSGQTDLNFDHFFMSFDLCLKEQPDPLARPGKVGIYRCMGSYFVYNLWDKDVVYRCSSFLDAVIKWCTLYSGQKECEKHTMVGDIRKQMIEDADPVMFLEQKSKCYYTGTNVKKEKSVPV